MLVCYDRWYPEAWRVLALSGARIVLVPNASEGYVSEMFVPLIRVSAAQNQVFAIAANRAGVEVIGDRSTSYYGRSCIAGPRGELLAEAGDRTRTRSSARSWTRSRSTRPANASGSTAIAGRSSTGRSCARRGRRGRDRRSTRHAGRHTRREPPGRDLATLRCRRGRHGRPSGRPCLGGHRGPRAPREGRPFPRGPLPVARRVARLVGLGQPVRDARAHRASRRPRADGLDRGTRRTPGAAGRAPDRAVRARARDRARGWGCRSRPIAPRDPSRARRGALRVARHRGLPRSRHRASATSASTAS